jgi:hypothetical protein
MFVGETITGGQGGYIACVSDGTTVYEIHAQGNHSYREFYSRPAAQGLADNHAAHLNAGKAPTFSFVRKA